MNYKELRGLVQKAGILKRVLTEELYRELAISMAETELFREGVTRFGDRDRRAWFVNRSEVAHVHSGGWIDLKVPKKLKSDLRTDPRAKPHENSDWMEFLLSST